MLLTHHDTRVFTNEKRKRSDTQDSLKSVAFIAPICTPICTVHTCACHPGFEWKNERTFLIHFSSYRHKFKVVEDENLRLRDLHKKRVRNEIHWKKCKQQLEQNLRDMKDLWEKKDLRGMKDLRDMKETRDASTQTCRHLSLNGEEEEDESISEFPDFDYMIDD